MLAATAAFALAMNTITEVFHTARLCVALVALVALHLLRFRRFLFRREFALYACFFAYMLIELLWTDDILLAMNTLVPALNFILILILFSALATYHDFHAVLTGALVGFLTSAAVYTATQGFPFTYPVDFPYNAVAGMYLFGLYITLLFGLYRRSKSLPLIVGSVLLLHIVATTSIKTNLGLLLGTAVAALIYFSHFEKVIRRNAILLMALASVLAFAVVSNDALVQSLQGGADRVMLGIEILQSREDRPGYSGLESRSTWRGEGLQGWTQNPLFGNGVESFRSQFGITSHSTPIDLLHNSGVIGLLLFYAIFVSLAWRALTARNTRFGGIAALTLGGVVCYLFMSLSGVMHYNTFLAVFVALSATLLGQDRERNSSSPLSSPGADS